MNCYENCSFYHYYDENKNNYCINSSICPDEYNKLIPDKKRCISNCSLDDTYLILKIYVIQNAQKNQKK